MPMLFNTYERHNLLNENILVVGNRHVPRSYPTRKNKFQSVQPNHRRRLRGTDTSKLAIITNNCFSREKMRTGRRF